MQRLVDEGAHRAQVRELQGPVERSVPGLRREYRLKEGTNEKRARGAHGPRWACWQTRLRQTRTEALQVSRSGWYRNDPNIRKRPIAGSRSCLGVHTRSRRACLRQGWAWRGTRTSAIYRIESSFSDRLIRASTKSALGQTRCKSRGAADTGMIRKRPIAGSLGTAPEYTSDLNRSAARQIAAGGAWPRQGSGHCRPAIACGPAGTWHSSRCCPHMAANRPLMASLRRRCVAGSN